MGQEKFLVKSTLSIGKCLIKIEENQVGFVITVDKKGVVNGVATDGDVRRYLIDGGTIADPVSACSNSDFVFVTEEASKEHILSKFNQQIKFVILLSKTGHFLNFFDKNNFPIQPEMSLRFRARAPFRISFGGGGSDLNHFFLKNDGAVLNATIKKYASADLVLRSDEKVLINSYD